MADIKVMFSKKTDDWKTPTPLYNILMKKGYIDPCPYQATEDGLKKNYYFENLFINPPFSKMKDWVNWGIRQYFINHCEVLFLIPARTDTKYFHELISWSPEICFIKGRLHYNDSEKNAPFPSLLIKLGYKLGDDRRSYIQLELDSIVYLIKENKLWPTE